MKGHPAFVAQHATATCCRGCLKKWYQIEKERALTDDEIGFVVELAMKWIQRQVRLSHIGLSDGISLLERDFSGQKATI